VQTRSGFERDLLQTQRKFAHRCVEQVSADHRVAHRSVNTPKLSFRRWHLRKRGARDGIAFAAQHDAPYARLPDGDWTLCAIVSARAKARRDDMDDVCRVTMNSEVAGLDLVWAMSAVNFSTDVPRQSAR
jgi:hypothetical protein